MRGRGVEQLNEGASCADRSALLRSLLGVLMDQREQLISGDVGALQQVNSRLSELLDAHTALVDGSWRPGPGVEAAELAELLSLAARVSGENAINYMLAVRGLQFAEMSSEMLEACTEAAQGPGMSVAGREGEETGPDFGAGYSLRLLDTRR